MEFDAYGRDLDSDAPGAFPEHLRQALYEIIDLRRDVRHFRPDPVADEMLDRILTAAHRAPSVGFSQPWRFVLVRDAARRARIRESFLRCREAEATRFPSDRREAYLAHRLEGIETAPLNLCVAVDLRDRGDAILGTTAQPEAVRASACCAVQNLWLAARAEGLGVGWVSIVEPAVLRRELALSPGVEPIAYLCVGHPVAFRRRPMLEDTGWAPRRALAEVVHVEQFRDDQPEDRIDPPAPRATAPGTPGALEGTAFSAEAERRAQAHSDRLTKPRGSLGRLEALAAWYAGTKGQFPPPPPERTRLVVFAADHGVAEEGVSAYGSTVTAAMLANVMAGGAAINALTAASGIELVLVDVGVTGDRSALPRAPRVPCVDARVRAGTANIRRAPAMTRDEALAAMAAGARFAGDTDLLAVGEIGIANTTSATALVAAITGHPVAVLVGRGTGVGDDVLARKQRVIEEALARSGPPSDPIDLLAELGGLELAAITGCLLEAARRRIPIVLDGFLTDAAALVAQRIEPAVARFLLASHRSAEPGAAAALDALGLEPLLDLGLRLGEGTGAALAVPLVRAAVRALAEMATFATAGVIHR